MPGRMALYQRVAAYSLYYLGLGIVKLVTLPIVIPLMQGALLLSLVDPLTARRYFGKVEETWALENVDLIKYSLDLPFHLGELNLTMLFNYAARCMQPTRIWNKGHLFQINEKSLKYYESYSLINELLKEHKAYFGPLYETLATKFADPRIRNEDNEEALQDAFNALNSYIRASHQIAEAEGEVDENMQKNQTSCLSILLKAKFDIPKELLKKPPGQL